MMEVEINTTEHMVLEELWYETEETYITRKKICLLYTSGALRKKEVHTRPRIYVTLFKGIKAMVQKT